MTTQSSPPSYYWFYQGDHRILVVAVGFGLGPRVAAENLLLDLKVIEDDEIHWRDSCLAYMADLDEVSLLLNFGVLSELPDFQPKQRIWIDCVDWLRTTLPPHVKNYDLLLREAFFPSAPSDDKGDIAKWHDVQPLIRPPKRDDHPDADLILLSFGGVATPYSTEVHMVEMPLAFLRSVKQCLDEQTSKRVVAFLPKNLLLRCQGNEEVSHDRLELRALDRTAFMEAMKRCGLLISQPGLYTPFEAMKMGVPFALTYPMSFTQDRQGAKFREMEVDCCQAPWFDEQALPRTDADIEVVEAQWFENSAGRWDQSPTDRIKDEVLSYLQRVLMAPTLTANIRINAPAAATLLNSLSGKYEKSTRQ